MIKEDYIHVAERYYTDRGMVALSIEGPGQGETRANGLTVDLTNYERAISRYVDYLMDLPEVDPQRIGMFGISMSGYCGSRAAATDHRLAALAAFEAVTGDFHTIFERAQPTFKNNYMFMTGYTARAPSIGTWPPRCRWAIWSNGSGARSYTASANSTNSLRSTKR